MKKLSLLLLAAVALGSCKKNDDNSPSAPSKTDLLTTKSWRPTTATVSITAAGTTLPLGSLSACNADDVVKFGTDKSFTADAGATKCDPTDPQTTKGTWSMPTDTQLTLMSAGTSSIPGGTFDIKELTSSTLHLYSAETTSGVTTTIDITMKAI